MYRMCTEDLANLKVWRGDIPQSILLDPICISTQKHLHQVYKLKTRLADANALEISQYAHNSQHQIWSDVPSVESGWVSEVCSARVSFYQSTVQEAQKYSNIWPGGFSSRSSAAEWSNLPCRLVPTRAIMAIKLLQNVANPLRPTPLTLDLCWAIQAEQDMISKTQHCRPSTCEEG